MNTSTPSRIPRRRNYVMLLLFTQMVIAYLDRVNISIAAPAISKQFHWDAATLGWVFSAYLWTYIIFLIPSGILLDRFGARLVATVAVSLWSLATVFTGMVTNLTTMILARLGLGIGEATTFPVCNKTVRTWFPSKERAYATSVYHSGMAVAVALGTPLVAWAVVHFGWRWSFVATAIPGFLWVLSWAKWFRQPEECSWLSAEERKLILETRQGSSGPTASPDAAGDKPNAWSSVKVLVRQKSIWGVCLAQGCMNYTNYLFMAWLPMYLVSRGMNLMKAGILTAIPNLVAAGMEIALGKLSDRLLTPEAVKAGKRRVHVATFFAVMIIIMLIRVLDSELLIVAIISIVMGCTAAVGALNAALTNDLIQDPKITGTAFGMLYFTSNSFGVAAPIITGYIVKATHSFNGAYIPAAALALLGAVLVMTMTRHPISAVQQTKAAAAAGKA
ncbi:MAG: MFS transporter [Candidatus Korobacteraceae bacterium]